MVDAGIMTVAEMTTCDHEGCENCAPTVSIHEQSRKTKELKAKPKGIHYCVYCSYIGKNFDGVYLCDFHYERHQGRVHSDPTHEKMDYSQGGCGHWTPAIGGTCDKCYYLDKAQPYKSYEAPEEIVIEADDGTVIKTYTNYLPEFESRMIQYSGNNIIRPSQVPDHANVYALEVDYNTSCVDILWKWPKYKHEEPCGSFAYRQKITTSLFDHWQEMSPSEVTELADESWEMPPGTRRKTTTSTGPQ